MLQAISQTDTVPVVRVAWNEPAAIMKALVVGFLSRQPVTYLLFGIGAIITIVMEMLGRSAMVFALSWLMRLSSLPKESGRPPSKRVWRMWRWMKPGMYMPA